MKATGWSLALEGGAKCVRIASRSRIEMGISRRLVLWVSGLLDGFHFQQVGSSSILLAMHSEAVRVLS